MAAASSESIKAAFAAANRDRLPSIGICVGMDTSAAPRITNRLHFMPKLPAMRSCLDLAGRDH